MRRYGRGGPEDLALVRVKMNKAKSQEIEVITLPRIYLNVQGVSGMLFSNNQCIKNVTL